MSENKLMNGVYNAGYGIVPKVVLKNGSLSPEAKAIYVYLSIHSKSNFGTSFIMPTEQRICSDLGIARVRYYKHRKKLEECGFLKMISNRDVNTNAITLPRAILSQECPKIEDNLDLAAAVTQEGILSQGYGLVPRSVFTEENLDISAKALYAYACTCAAANLRADRFAQLNLKEIETVFMSSYKIKKACKDLVNAGFVEIKKSTVKGYSTLVLLLYPHNTDHSPNNKKVFEPGMAQEFAEQEKMLDSFLNPSPKSDAPHNMSNQQEQDMVGLIEKAIRVALNSIKNDNTGNSNTTGNNNTIYYQPVINIYLDKSHLFSSNNIDQTGREEINANQNCSKGEFEFQEKIQDYVSNNNTTVKYDEDAINKKTITQNPRGIDFYLEQVYEQVDAYRYMNEEGDFEASAEARLVESACLAMARIYEKAGTGDTYVAGRRLSTHSVEDIFRQVKAEHLDFCLFKIE